ncbi:hypothetical protein [Corynebacterium cystitidis]|uniref:hypothetical protein n=1 Tax=Corynebacterium cystitidis TaxID=35757 RepID=UPI00358DADD1
MIGGSDCGVDDLRVTRRAVDDCHIVRGEHARECARVADADGDGQALAGFLGVVSPLGG